MKKFIYLLALIATVGLVSCESVKSGHKGVEVSFGGETNLRKVYDEGMSTGLHWLWDDIVEYDCRERTQTFDFEFNDKNNMATNVEIAVDYNPIPSKVNVKHTKITDVETKVEKTIKSAGKEVVPQYGAVELNLHKRAEAEKKLSEILSAEFPEFYQEFKRVQITDVDLPHKVSMLAEQTAVQLGKNELASKKKAEEEALAAARIAKAKGNFEAAEFDAKTKKILSKPEMLKLKELEIELEWARQGKSKYGSNNIFGSNTAVVKGLK